MSNLMIDGIDDPVLDAGSSGFQGLNSRLRAALIQDQELSKADDNLIGETGMAQTRFPVKAVNNAGLTEASGEGIFFFDIRTKERIIASVNNGLWEVNQLIAGTWTDLSHTTAGDCRFAQLIDNMYFVDGEEYWKWDGTTFTRIFFFSGTSTPLPKFKDIISHGTRNLLSVIDDNDYDDDAIYATDLLDGDTINITYGIRIGAGDGDPIKKILSWHDSFIAVLKEKSTYVVNTSTRLGQGATPSDPVYWVVELVSNTLGCIAPNTATVVGNDVWFLSRDGLTSLRRIKESTQRQLSAVVLNTPVNDVFEDINWDYADEACAGYFNNRYYLSIPVGTSKVPNVTLVFNTLTQQWEGKTTGTAWQPKFFTRSSFGNNRHLVFQDVTGNVFWQREQGGVYEGRDQLPGLNQTSGTLTVGEAYTISTFVAGDDFTNVGAASNATGQQFVATGTTPTTYSNGSTLTKFVFEAINLDVITKAWDFGYPVNFKSGFNLEIDFYRSHGTVDIYLIPDDDDSRILTVGTAVSTTGNPSLPQTLPISLSGAEDVRAIYEIRGIEEFKELKCHIVGNGSEVKVRRVHITSFLNTMEIDNT